MLRTKKRLYAYFPILLSSGASNSAGALQLSGFLRRVKLFLAIGLFVVGVGIIMRPGF